HRFRERRSALHRPLRLVGHSAKPPQDFGLEWDYTSYDDDDDDDDFQVVSEAELNELKAKGLCKFH
ncbi:MAG: hypothetical protein ACFNYA_07610, partial [Capnocytophaga granulosa]